MIAQTDPFETPRKRLQKETRTLAVYGSGDFSVVCGANAGDGLGTAADMMLDDIYSLKDNIETAPLMLVQTERAFVVSPLSTVGMVGNKVHLDCSVTLMQTGTKVIEALVLVEVNQHGHVEGIYLSPFAPLLSKREYTLLRVDQQKAAQKLAQLACASFSRGTQITLDSGHQCAVEDLSIGSPVLTRDNGMQPVRWISQYTERAEGAFAPIRIAAGTLDNTHDLIVSPDHRLFFYQREDHLGTGRPEVMIRARHLVDGHSVTVQEGGFVDYFQIHFDVHQVIYAGGIAAESTMVNATTAPLLETQIPELLESNPASGSQLHEFDLRGPHLLLAQALDLLKRGSKG